MKLFLIFALALSTCLFAMSEIMVGKPHKYTPKKDAPELAFAIKAITRYFSMDNDVKLIKVVSATKQVVAGVLYALTLRVSGPKEEPEDCSLEIWAKPWMNWTNIHKNVTCTAATGAATEAIEVYVNRRWETFIYFMVSNKPDVSTCQVPSGITLQFKNVEFRETNCSKMDVLHKVESGDPHPADGCKIDITKTMTVQTVDYLVQFNSSTKKYEVSEVKKAATEAATEAVEISVNKKMNNAFYILMSNKPNVSTCQVLSGVTFQLKNVEFGGTKCLKTEVLSKVESGDPNPTAGCKIDIKTPKFEPSVNYLVQFNSSTKKYEVSEVNKDWGTFAS